MAEKRTWKLGDRLAYDNIEDDERSLGNVVEIRSVGGEQRIRIAWDEPMTDNGLTWWKADDPELHVPASDTIKSKWAVSDRVRFIDGDDGEQVDGTVDQVAFERYEPDTYHIRITWDDGQEDLSWWSAEDEELTLLKKSEAK